jgi:predicted transcriptional regulator
MEILRALWVIGPAELGRIRAELEKRRAVATSTVATMLSVMLGKKLVKRTDGPRGYVWSARVSRTQAAADLVRKVLDHVFDGSALRLVAHLLHEGQLNDRDQEEIRRLLAAHDARKSREAEEPNR